MSNMEDIVCPSCATVNDYRTERGGGGSGGICNNCDRYLKMLPQGEVKLYFGKYKGRELSSLTSKEELGWLDWAVKNCNLKPTQKTQFINQINKHKE